MVRIPKRQAQEEGGGEDSHLAEFNPEIEEKQRGESLALDQRSFRQDSGKTEAVEQAKKEDDGDPTPGNPGRAQEVLEADDSNR